MSESDFLKKNKPKITQIDWEDGMVFVPGVGMLPIVGPTSGKAVSDLKDKESIKREFNKRLIAAMSKTWQCTQCGEKMSGKFIRIAHQRPKGGGPVTEVLVCRHRTCDAPVVEVSGPPDGPTLLAG